MIKAIILLIVGLGLILWGANALTDGASAIARRIGVSDLIVGLTVVSFGTSMPELTISMFAAIGGDGSMAIGNVVGSNIFNILCIVGITALIRPIQITRSITTNEIPLVILSSIALLAIGAGPWLGAGADRIISRADGILLLLFFAIFMRYVIASAKTQPSEPTATPTPQKKAWVAVLMVIAGLAALIYGGELFVDSASAIASALGMSEAMIGLTIVAVGTSLPELATSIVAAVKGNAGIAVGNVIGSNIFNIFMILGCTATVQPLLFGGITIIDLLVLTTASLMFWLFGWKFQKLTFTRTEGAILLACYIAYTTYLILAA